MNKVKFKKPRFKPNQIVWYINYDVVEEKMREQEIGLSIVNTVEYNRKYTWYILNSGRAVDDYLCFKNPRKANKYLCKFKSNFKKK